MVNKLTDPKTIEKLAILAAAKIGPEDDIAKITKKVIEDYLGAKEIIQQYNDALPSGKIAREHLRDKKSEQKNEIKIKTKKPVVDK